MAASPKRRACVIRSSRIFAILHREHLRADPLVHFTVAEGAFPLLAPDCPVICLVKGKGRVPWGERIQLN